MKKVLFLLIIIFTLSEGYAQRTADKLDRGLIALPASGGGFLVSWRLLGEEYYDVTYNVYRDGEKIATEVATSNYKDSYGKSTSTYSVSAVVRGVEQPQCAAVKAWSTSYKQINLSHEGIKSTLVPNDACCADVDGDGELEILMKFDNQDEINQSYPKNGPAFNGVSSNEFSILECFKLDGTRLWWVNCGPNMGDFQNNEINIVAYDWDGDGKAEAVMRAADGTTIHTKSGEVITIGNASKNFRGATGGGTNWFMHAGAEYLVYMNGSTGETYQVMDFPLPRLEKSENPNGLESGSDYDNLVNKYWGDGYGHRSSKYFFGAPYLDGRQPSIFLARGIYTQHKMVAYDVNPLNHSLVQRWRWSNNVGGAWYGQGYHNYSIADVDEDGRDEIVFGSMVIDDNGKGLSTAGLGHGDAHHVGDFNPYTKGLEFFGCNEDRQGFNYRDATTSKLYAATLGVGKDVGRSMAGNFTEDYPGGLGSAWGDPISTVTGKSASGLVGTGVNTNFRIYWDGDLCSETFNGEGTNDTPGVIAKYGSWSAIYKCEGSLTNNYTKATPCYQGDILGDWREEIIMRTSDNNIRIYSTPNVTTYRIPTLWSDHQYRNAMVWQMCGYNQPPHISYFLGKLEEMTIAPPPLTMNGRVEVENGGTIGASLNDQHVIVCQTNDAKVTLEENAQPYILTFNVPSWVQGTGASNSSVENPTIKYKYYECTVAGGSLTGGARLVKQGDGILNLPANEFTHTGESHIWAGTLNFDGKMVKSDLTLDRFTTLNSNGGAFKTIKALYASTLNPGGKEVGTMTIDSLHMDFGSRLIIDINGTTCDQLKLRALTSVKKTGVWSTAGPEYIQPVIEVRGTDLQAGDYVIAECTDLNCSVTNFKLEGADDFKKGLKHENGKLILTLGDTRGATTVYWTGAKSSVWNFAGTENFALTDNGEASIFVSGDDVEFNDSAKQFSVVINEELNVDTVRFTNNSKAYTLSGTGAIVKGALVKEGAGKVTIKNLNKYTGGNYLRGGTIEVTALSNDIAATGALGGVTTSNSKFVFENGANLSLKAAVTNGSPMKMVGEEGGVITNTADLVQQKGISGTILTKKGSGKLRLQGDNSSLGRLVITAGSMASEGSDYRAPKVLELQGGTIYDYVSTGNEMNIPASKKTIWYPANRQTYSNTLTGKGQITIYSASEKGNGWVAIRTPLSLNLSQFEGTIVAKPANTDDKRFTLNTGTGSSTYTLNIPAGTIVQNNGRTLQIGTITGAGTLGGSCVFSNGASAGANTWKVGNAKDFSFDGIVTSNDNFTKVGSGTMTTTGEWNTTGSIVISEGSVNVTSSTGNTSLGTGKLTINQNGRLWGALTNDLSNSSYVVSGTLMPASFEGYATGSLGFGNKAVTINQAGTLRIVIEKASTGDNVMSGANIENISTLTLNGLISLAIRGDYVPAPGDKIRLWKNVTSVTGKPTVEIDDLTCKFDLSYLDEGYILVTEVTSIEQICGNDEDHTLYDLNGRKMERSKDLPAGIYVRNHKKIIIR